MDQFDTQVTDVTESPEEALPRSPQYSPYFTDAKHALMAGMVWGLMMKYGIPATPLVDDYGNYTGKIRITDEGFQLMGIDSITITVDPPV